MTYKRSRAQKCEDKAFQALGTAINHLIDAEGSFGDEGWADVEHAAVKNIRKTVDHCRDMLNELQWTRVRAQDK